mmetsp:Transcript_21540/g.54298  ORF Transcript_21540/g.54298 Transcript_21540/m.54298 type:complete len:278 (-) Transcript_21540:1520-2353(-)
MEVMSSSNRSHASGLDEFSEAPRLGLGPGAMELDLELQLLGVRLRLLLLLLLLVLVLPVPAPAAAPRPSSSAAPASPSEPSLVFALGFSTAVPSAAAPAVRFGAASFSGPSNSKWKAFALLLVVSSSPPLLADRSELLLACLRTEPLLAAGTIGTASCSPSIHTPSSPNFFCFTNSSSSLFMSPSKSYSCDPSFFLRCLSKSSSFTSAGYSSVNGGFFAFPPPRPGDVLFERFLASASARVSLISSAAFSDTTLPSSRITFGAFAGRSHQYRRYGFT